MRAGALWVLHFPSGDRAVLRKERRIPAERPLATFVDYWASQYADGSEHLYEANIGRPLTYRAIVALYEWKNGMKLSPEKRESVERNYIQRKSTRGVTAARKFPRSASLNKSKRFARRFLVDCFPVGGAIWRIFWLHCCNQRFAIYDQHVHRAMVFIECGSIEELDGFSEDQKIELYIERYLPFVGEFSGEHRAVDRAFFTFGRFLKP